MKFTAVLLCLCSTAYATTYRVQIFNRDTNKAYTREELATIIEEFWEIKAESLLNEDNTINITLPLGCYIIDMADPKVALGNLSDEEISERIRKLWHGAWKYNQSISLSNELLITACRNVVSYRHFVGNPTPLPSPISTPDLLSELCKGLDMPSPLD